MALSSQKVSDYSTWAGLRVNSTKSALTYMLAETANQMGLSKGDPKLTNMYKDIIRLQDKSIPVLPPTDPCIQIPGTGSRLDAHLAAPN